jgi:membrane protease YdiL (CAAX protease family)
MSKANDANQSAGELQRELRWFAIWLVAVAAGGMVIQWLVNLVGGSIDIRDDRGDGRAILLALAAAGALKVIGAQRRETVEYGLAIDENWLRRFLPGLAIGAGVFLLYAAVAVSAGAASVQLNAPPGRWLSNSTTALLALLIAPLQEIVYRGYMLTVARKALGTAGGVIVVSILFALTISFHADHWTFAPHNRSLLAAMFALGLLLGMMRLVHGAIVAPVGLLAGWLYLSILTQRTHVFIIADNDAAAWFMPGGEAIKAPAFAALAFVAALAYSVVLIKRGPAPVPDRSPAMDATFKKLFPFANVSGLAPLDLWLSLLVTARFRIGLLYIPRLAAVLTSSAVNTVLSLPERLLVPLLLRGVKVKDPVFIVGAHRSGTTHLHNLIALDPRFVSPRTYQVFNPHGFLISGWLLVPLMILTMPWRRPMDNVAFSFLAPQEEEFALMHMSRMSPQWIQTFPRCAEQYERYNYPEGFTAAERRRWQRDLLNFLRRLCVFNGKRPALKDPYNTGRVAMLTEVFPHAKFIHIHRNPYSVYRSNVNIEREMHVLMQVQDQPKTGGYAERYLDHYTRMEQHFYAAAATLPGNRVAEVRFEDLEQDPIGVIERVYAQLDMELTGEYRRRLESYLASIAGYRKNVFRPLPPEEQKMVYEKLKPLFDRWGYEA